MANPWKKRVLAFNRAMAANREAAQDLIRLLSLLPPGQKKQLMADEGCSAILMKYGIAEEGNI